MTCGQLVRHVLLVAEMFGLEAMVALEIGQMFSNLQVLDVPVKLFSVATTASPVVGIFLIPGLGIAIDRIASSKQAKAKILTGVTGLSLLGTSLVCAGNIMKLMKNAQQNDSIGITQPTNNMTFKEHPTLYWNNSMFSTNQSFTKVNNLTKTLEFELNEISPTIKTRRLPTNESVFADFSKEIALNINDISSGQNSTPGNNTNDAGLQIYAILAMMGYGFTDIGYDTCNCFLKTFTIACTPPEDHAGIIVKQVFLSALGGVFSCIFGLVGAGDRLLLLYIPGLNPNAANIAVQSALCLLVLVFCFIMTLSTGLCCFRTQTPTTHIRDVQIQNGESESLLRPDEAVPNSYTSNPTQITTGDQTSVISFPRNGNTTNTSRRNSLLTASLNNLNIPYTVLQPIASQDNNSYVRTTFSSIYGSYNEQLNHQRFSENTRARSNSENTRARSYSENPRANNYSDRTDVVGEDKDKHADISSTKKSLTDLATGSSTESAHAVRSTQECDNAQAQTRSSIMEFLTRQRKQLLISITMFFLMGSLYSYEMFCTNFVSIAIYGGDPNAPVDSPSYRKFLKGVQMGTAGVMTNYASYAISTFFVGITLPKLGCVRMVWIASFIHQSVALALIISECLWLYFAASVTIGFYRAVGNTVPYILANQISQEMHGEKNSGVAIAVVSSMLPLAFSLCSAIMGPLIHVTNNTAVPLIYSVVSALLGLAFFAFFKN